MKITWIEPGILAASSIPISDENLRSLHEQGIRAILSLTEQPLTTLRTITPETIVELGLQLCHVPVPDHHAPTLQQAEEIVSILMKARQASQPVLVHCHAGIGRTGTILHLYFLAQGQTLAAARAAVRRARPQSTLLSTVQQEFLAEFAARRGVIPVQTQWRLETAEGGVALGAREVAALELKLDEPIKAGILRRRLAVLGSSSLAAALHALLDQSDDNEAVQITQV